MTFSRGRKNKLRNSEKKAEIAIIGGTGLEEFVKDAETIRLGTPYGVSPQIFTTMLHGRKVAFLPRHGVHHTIPPHKINFRANIYALYSLGVKRILATNAVGAINPKFKPADLAVPHDLIDFTKFRKHTFYDDAPVTHIDFSQPYCPQIRHLLIENAKKLYPHVQTRAVIVCTEGPRFETPAEIEMFRRLGCDVVGMTSSPEAVLARELEMCYATICYVSNMAAGIQKELSTKEVHTIAEQVMPILQKILIETVRVLPQKRDCPCAKALTQARFGNK
jgi:5'-methylthioadenosine phosphorylase